ncbi:hypothetical protein VNI00_007144 [Paramarasmius palmivorus]|uniref:AA9 family lytic polysaccharide monooxygenase n=1 Tax=Paramarasmius palmivorus TaxID=297713 RepID=A0AAW0D3C1_9AGAR
MQENRRLILIDVAMWNATWSGVGYSSGNNNLPQIAKSGAFRSEYYTIPGAAGTNFSLQASDTSTIYFVSTSRRLSPYASSRQIATFGRNSHLTGVEGFPWIEGREAIKAHTILRLMRLAATFASLALLAQCASAHYIWTTIVAGGTTSSAAVRQPPNNSPVQDVTSADITCNVSPAAATETVEVPAGSDITFQLDNTLYHQGPAAVYLGQAPGSAADWDGSGANWFKIAEWGAEFDPFNFVDFNLSELTATIPASVPDGEYLAR